jgi:hypothetical protein
MSNPTPDKPLSRNPTPRLPEDIKADDPSIPYSRDGELTIDKDEEQTADDDDIVGPDGNRG